MKICEIWKDIEGYEKFYQVSNLGNVRSKDRIQKYKNMKRKGKVLKLQPNSNGYLRVQLKIEAAGEKKFVHRLVAEAFLPKAKGKNIVNHLDSVPTNNNVDNLEWTTFIGNMHHAIKKGRFDRTEEWLRNQRLSLEQHDKPVVGINIKNQSKVNFRSIQDARKNGFDAGSICYCCKGVRQTHKGYIWNYLEGDNNEMDFK